MYNIVQVHDFYFSIPEVHDSFHFMLKNTLWKKYVNTSFIYEYVILTLDCSKIRYFHK